MHLGARHRRELRQERPALDLARQVELLLEPRHRHAVAQQQRVLERDRHLSRERREQVHVLGRVIRAQHLGAQEQRAHQIAAPLQRHEQAQIQPPHQLLLLLAREPFHAVGEAVAALAHRDSRQQPAQHRERLLRQRLAGAGVRHDAVRRQRHDMGVVQDQRLGHGVDGAGQQHFQIDRGLELASQVAQHIAVIRGVAQEHLVQELLQAGDHRLEQRQDQEHRLQHLGLAAGEDAHVVVQPPHDQQVGADQEAGSQRVQDAPARQQLQVEELVAHDRVRDRSRAQREREDREHGAPRVGHAEVEQPRHQGRDAVAHERRAHPDRDRAELPPQPRHFRPPPAIEQQRHGGEPDAQVHEREQRLMEHEEQAAEHARHLQQRRQQVQRSLGGRRQVRLPHRDQHHQHEVEHVRREHQRRESGSPQRPVADREPGDVRERPLLREHAREREQRGKEELPHVRHVLEQIRRRSAAAPRQERDAGQHRAERAEEQHQRHQPVHPLGGVLAQDHEAQQEHEPPETQVERAEREVGVHRPPVCGPARPIRFGPRPRSVPTGSGRPPSSRCRRAR